MKRIALVGKDSKLSSYMLGQFALHQWEHEVLSLRKLSTMTSEERSAFWDSSRHKFDTFIFAAAVIDPSSSKKTLNFLNFEIPTHAIEIMWRANEPKQFLTLGSALEGVATENPYIASKHRLGVRASDGDIEGWTHIRTHTLVGRTPPPKHMMLGQLLEALRSKTDFTIHGTKQMREYIHYDQFAAFVTDVLDGPDARNLPPTLQVGGTEKTLVADLVKGLMVKFNPESRLHVDESLGWSSDQTVQTAAVNDFTLQTPKALDLVGLLAKNWLAGRSS